MKTPMPVAVVALATIAACAESHATHEATLVDLTYDAPVEWKSTNTTDGSSSIETWTPVDNVNKESVEIIRTALRHGTRDMGIPKMQELLVAAQASLPHAKVTAPTMLLTPRGLSGVMLSADFTPPSLHRSYHRVHAVLIDQGTLIHVLYTAATPDDDLKAFNVVLQSIGHGEA